MVYILAWKCHAKEERKGEMWWHFPHCYSLHYDAFLCQLLMTLKHKQCTEYTYNVIRERDTFSPIAKMKHLSTDHVLALLLLNSISGQRTILMTISKI